MPHGGSRPGAGRKRKDPNAANDTGKLNSKQLQELLTSPYVTFVSKSTVSFSAEFKKLFWQRYCDGVDGAQIFHDAGINPLVVGKARINSQTTERVARQRRTA